MVPDADSSRKTFLDPMRRVLFRFFLTEHQTFQVPVTNRYTHLGGLLHHAADQRLEIKRCLAVAHAAFNQHRRVLYHNKTILLAKRCELFQVLILSKLIYGAERWLITDDRTVHCLHSSIIKLYRRLLRVPHDQHLSDDEIVATVELPSPHVLLRRQCLRYLGTLLQPGVCHDWVSSWKIRIGVLLWNKTCCGCGNNCIATPFSKILGQILLNGAPSLLSTRSIGNAWLREPHNMIYSK